MKSRFAKEAEKVVKKIECPCAVFNIDLYMFYAIVLPVFLLRTSKNSGLFSKEAEKAVYETARVARRKIENRDFLGDVLTSIDCIVWQRVTDISFTN